VWKYNYNYPLILSQSSRLKSKSEAKEGREKKGEIVLLCGEKLYKLATCLIFEIWSTTGVI